VAEASPAATIRLGGSPADRAACGVLCLALTILLLLFVLPLLIVIAIAVKVQDGGPVIFAQERIGRGGKPFKCLKFRTMRQDAATRLNQLLDRDPAARAEWAADHKLKNDPRVTPVGDFLRRASLDELPQLLNVLRGEMAIVGPRPIVAAEISRYGSRFRHYCAVKPGITGPWQVSGRNDVSYRRRVALDTIYARNRSFAWDLVLLGATLPAVLLSRGSY
jgi:exopolysaccharide production protein ExoY